MEARKKKNSSNEGQKEDRLSRLPDELLHHILSFLNAKYAVQTSVLSKRWTFLWKSLPFLDFNYHTFPYKTSVSEERKISSFGHFIFEVIFRRRPTNLVKLRYASPQVKLHRKIALMLICYAVEHKVEELDVNQCCYKPIVLPQSFYACESLAVVKFNNGIQLPKPLAFPALKSLHLDGFSMTEENFDPGIFSGSPNLETLKLVDILFGDLKMLSIHALNLRNLEISFSSEVSYTCKVVIHTPRLTSFKYGGYASMVISTVSLVSLDHAYVDLHWNPYLPKQEDALCLINMLKQFRQAKYLSLSVSTAKVLASFRRLLDDEQLDFLDLNHLMSKLASSRVRTVDYLGLSGTTSSQLHFVNILQLKENP